MHEEIDRQSPKYWDKQIESARHRDMANALDNYVRYSTWFGGDMGDIADDVKKSLKCKDKEVVSVNLTSLAIRQARASMFYRAPTAMVRPVEGFGATTKFTPALAKLETRLLNDWTEEADLFLTGRRTITDGLMGPYMVMKVGYSAQIDVDHEAIELERENARMEDLEHYTLNKKPVMSPKDLHKVHLDQHRMTLDQAIKGTIQMSDAQLAYLKKHIKKHEEALTKTGEQQVETIRHARVYANRVNPTSVFFDPWADSFSTITWVGQHFIKLIDEVEADTRYTKEGRENLRETCRKYESPFVMEITAPLNGNTEARYCRIFEIVDLRERQVITYAEGSEVPLWVRPYALADILPSGPYIFASFMEHPLQDIGIPLPKIFESHQRAACFLASLNMQVARRSLPKMVYSSDSLTPQEIQKVAEGAAAGLIPLKNLSKGNRIADLFVQVPTLEIPMANFGLEASHKNSIEQLSGLGSAGMAGGDFSKTATASEVARESTNGLSEDFASVLDDFLQRVYRAVLRLMRRFYPPELVAALVGEQALEIWPEEWSTWEIVQDKGASIVPGSSKRKNEAVQQSMIMKAIEVIVGLPALQTNVALQIDLAGRLFDSMGLYGIDLEGAMKVAQMQQAVQMVQANTPQVPPGAMQGTGEPASAAGLSSAAKNTGAPTGASKGDKPRPDREKAK